MSESRRLALARYWQWSVLWRRGTEHHADLLALLPGHHAISHDVAEGNQQQREAIRQIDRRAEAQDCANGRHVGDFAGILLFADPDHAVVDESTGATG